MRRRQRPTRGRPLNDESGSPTAAYALALACLAAGDDPAAARAAAQMAIGGEAFERTAAALAALAAGDEVAYATALRAVIDDFEARDVHLTGVAIADTALVLERLAEPRGNGAGRSLAAAPAALGPPTSAAAPRCRGRSPPRRRARR